LSAATKNRTSLFGNDPFLITENTGKEIMEWLHTGVYIDESKTISKKQEYFDEINKITDINILLDICNKAKSEFENDIGFVEKLRSAYSQRKAQIEFIGEMGDTPDQRYDEKDVPQ